MPSPFKIGEMYEDWDGTYKVVSLDGDRVTFVRPDGTQDSGTIEGKFRIYQNVLLKRKHPNPLSYHESRSGSHESAYTYEEATPIVAEVIDKHSKRSTDYIDHAHIVEALLGDPEACSIIDRIHDDKSPEGRAGVIIAGFSKQWTEGRWERFDRMKIGRGHAWRVKRRR